MAQKQWLTILEGATYCGIKEFYMRKMVRSGRIPTKHQAINKKGGFKHLINVSDLDNYLATKGRKNDGKRAFIYRADDETNVKIQALLKKHDTSSAPRYKRKKK